MQSPIRIEDEEGHAACRRWTQHLTSSLDQSVLPDRPLVVGPVYEAQQGTWSDTPTAICQASLSRTVPTRPDPSTVETSRFAGWQQLCCAVWLQSGSFVAHSKGAAGILFDLTGEAGNTPGMREQQLASVQATPPGNRQMTLHDVALDDKYDLDK